MSRVYVTMTSAVIGLVSASLAGCTTASGYFSTDTSKDAAQLDAFAGDAVATDLIARLADHVGPGSGTIALRQDDSAFAGSLGKQLRSLGYAVDPSATGVGAIPLAYMVDTADGQVLVRLTTSSVEIGRTYSISSGVALPASPVSVMRRAEATRTGYELD
ncbi:MAG: conjugal transfer protein TrbH [Pseudorhizobium sp.]